jgi:tetratricopeptide (TPR) repeat protein
MKKTRALLVCLGMVAALYFGAIGLAQKQDQPAQASSGQTNQPSPQASDSDEDSDTKDSSGERDKSVSRERQQEMSSSNDTRVDLSPPAGDDKRHPQSGTTMIESEDQNGDVQEFQKWDPHKAAKDIEVGEFYYKRKNYGAALDRYKEALQYKPNDAIATYRLAECQDKTGHPSEAIEHYEAYLKILPHGPFAADAQKALQRLKADGPKESSAR